ncbi:2-aminoadipate aminotransferase [Kiloniella spongiae]|uniref:2-aminoadipate aminotransferase n=1 Tax=Kiloniella spongiae TaxID=1489064 RepID=A0A0H2MCL1_9PROT|nr:PLP-dependent aminotransferase family protein [Kiloniella spongiae]KLN60083.1 2-aminoadipate aminotransferase [Kiloniella spongiae]
MSESLFILDKGSTESLQLQIRRQFVSAILGGSLPAGNPVPSSRKLAEQLNVSRITVTQAYNSLIDDGYLTSKERSGIYVSDRLTLPLKADKPSHSKAPPLSDPVFRQMKHRPSHQQNIEKPENWRDYPYPFVTAQVDKSLFPIAAWRECSRQALSLNAMADWTEDRLGVDDPFLIEQIRTRLLPTRGIHASEEEILVTAGAQNSLYILSRLFLNNNTLFGMENPGYPDLRNIIQLIGSRIQYLNLDHHGLIPDQQIDNCNVLAVTPSHQFPTTVTMPLQRRKELLERVETNNTLVIEDDYEPELNFESSPTPALKSLDSTGRVVYVGSLSKSFFPGLRLGYLVASKEIIQEARALGRLMHRHTPTNNQRTMALFLALGHHDALRKKLRRIYKNRWLEMKNGLETMGINFQRSSGGSSFWVEGAKNLDSKELLKRALKKGVVLEPGTIYDFNAIPPKHFFRLGYTAIEHTSIENGLKQLHSTLNELSEV